MVDNDGMKVLFDNTNPNDDIWRKFLLPLTPPRSPQRTFGESSDCNASIQDITDQLQDVCDSLDSAFDVHSSKKDSVSLRSKLISDCMWSGNHQVEVRTTTKKSITYPQKRLSIESEEVKDLYPTPCPSPLPNVMEPTDYPSRNDCVDPTSVFPFTHQENMASLLSAQSDTDEEIDVVTVDSATSPVRSMIGSKRKYKPGGDKGTIIFAKIENTSIPALKRTKSSPAKLSFDVNEKKKDIRSSSSSLQEDSDPESRRATHNVLERKRRIDLKKSFERLRECVPNLEKIDKTPKVIVLKKAAFHIEELNRNCELLEEQKQILTEEREELTIRLNSLKQYHTLA